MKKVALAVLVLFCVFAIPVQADDIVHTFAWDQEANIDVVNYWMIYWGTTAGGPYDVGSVRIDKVSETVAQQADATVIYPGGQKTTMYFVCVSFIDSEHFSINSNEINHTEDLIGQPACAVNFRFILN